MSVKDWAKLIPLIGLLSLGSCQSATIPETGFEQSLQPSFSSQNSANASTVSHSKTDAILQAIFDQREDLGLCSFSFNQEQSKQWSEVYPSDNEVYLAQILCFNAAYQGAFAFARVDTSKTPIQITPLPLTLAGYPSYDPDTQVLSNGYKFRGVGDCIEETEHRWTGSSLRLLTSTLQEALPGSCDAFQGGEGYVISSNQVGQAQLGMTLGELKAVMGNEGSFSPLNLWLEQGSGMRVSHYGEVLYDIGFAEEDGTVTDAAQITSIQVQNPAFKTAEGIGPGTALEDAIAAYGQATLKLNQDDASREFISFDGGASDNLRFLSNQWALDGEAGIYEGEETSDSTTSYKSKAAIGAVIVSQP